jgi:hypothetical protein
MTAPLTTREIEIIRIVADGKTYKETAAMVRSEHALLGIGRRLAVKF